MYESYEYGKERAMSVVVIAEKPSVARDIAKLLGVGGQGEGYLFGYGYTVSWALGHLVALAEPHEIDPAWKLWRRDLLPMLPDKWPLVVLKKTQSQFAVLRKLMRDATTERIICATDAGREGELIFRYVYEKARCTKPVERLWISSLTPEAIRKGLAQMKKSTTYDALAAAAKGRSQADWLVGMNLSRLYTLIHGETLSVGRVQTPTLAMLVDRTNAIAAFVPEDYREVTATFAVSTGEYIGVYFYDDKKNRLPADGEQAEAIAKRARIGHATVESIDKKLERRPPPLLYDLTELQRHANRLFGFSAQHTLQLAQNLYEKHKLISYPRTDSRHLTTDMAGTLGHIVEVIKGPYLDKLAPGTGVRPLSSRFVDNAKVADHHAIIPTPVSSDRLPPGSEEARIYDLICRRLLAAWQEDYLASVTTVITSIITAGAAPMVDRYRSSGTLVERLGWHLLDPPSQRMRKTDGVDRYAEQTFPEGLCKGQKPAVTAAEILDKQTKPPHPFTEATLLTAMETAGRSLEDKTLSDAMRENGLGTPATRAAIIETLLAREYIIRRGKSLFATDKGIHLIQVVHAHVKSPAMTGEWEHRLKEIERGRDRLDAFMTDIEAYVREVVLGAPTGAPRAALPPPLPSAYKEHSIETAPAYPAAPQRREAKNRPIPGERLSTLLQRAFGFDGFRPHQEAVCEAVTAGNDVLLVMPTGAGKSLCYQLPGIARGGTTLVISPLIALMEDQTAALRQNGFSAERIHSGQSRETSRQACRLYLNGELDFLFIAPERLRVPGFPDMLAKRLPVLIAVDEAHCISHWGHDFRPDYRMLKERLSLLRASPVIAMTATATPTVQNDIVAQLGIPRAKRFIHGFRRTNIGVEIVELPPSARSEATLRLLEEPKRRPAIVYAPTRKKAEQLAADFQSGFSAAAYHAGMSAAMRDRVQSDFLAGRLDVIVATIAFGMGIDKPNVRTVIHVALPGSMESYYQEIGRAGRDGLPSQAILMHSYADLKTHEFFLTRDYPEPSVLERVYRSLTSQKQPRERLMDRLGLDEEMLGTVLEKLWIHGGADVSPDEYVSIGDNHWRQTYEEQCRHKQEQLALVSTFAQSKECRMLRLVRHFGDLEDGGERCGQCDICLPKTSTTRRTRTATGTELKHMERLLRLLQMESEQAKGRVYRDEFETSLTRKEYEGLVEALFRAGLIEIKQDNFIKEGRVVEFQRLSITPEGYQALRIPKGLADRIHLGMTESAKRGRGTRKKGIVTSPIDDRNRKKKRDLPLKRATRAPEAPPSGTIVSELKTWRLALARARNIPAFTILTDRVVNHIAAACPQTEEALLEVSGVGETILKRYGEKILAICKQER